MSRRKSPEARARARARRRQRELADPTLKAQRAARRAARKAERIRRELEEARLRRERNRVTPPPEPRPSHECDFCTIEVDTHSNPTSPRKARFRGNTRHGYEARMCERHMRLHGRGEMEEIGMNETTEESE